jgi:hypothetical protein
MRRGNKTTGTFGVACLGLFGCAGFAGVVTGLHVNSAQMDIARASLTTPIEVISQRFPALAVSTAPAAYALASVAPSDDAEMFSPRPFYPLQAGAPPAEEPAAAPEPDVADARKARAAVAARPEAAKPEAAKPEATKSGAPRHHAGGRPGGVLNDAQIASIRARLKLTPDQEAMWPAVEAALRNIVYARNAAESHGRSGAMAYIDPNSDEVRQLKFAALPLIMRLDDDQRREVKQMAHVMGLENVASQF